MEDLKAPQNKHWLSWAIAGLISADGKIKNAEMEHLRMLFANFCEPAVSEVIVGTIKEKKKISLEVLPLEDRRLVANIIKHLVSISIEDGEVDSEERKYLQYIGEKLGLPGQAISRVIAWQKGEFIKQAESRRAEGVLNQYLKGIEPKYL